MIVNGTNLLALSPIENMLSTKERAHGVSYGLSEVGYDIRLKEQVSFLRGHHYGDKLLGNQIIDKLSAFRFCMASSVERFTMPEGLVGIVHNKSTWARQGVMIPSVVLEPGWSGHMTLAIHYQGESELLIPSGAGIAQVIFHRIEEPASYAGGKYDNQESRPVAARFM